MKAEIIALKVENAKLREEVKDARAAVGALQKVVHFLEKDRRAKNVVVRGISESESLGDCTSDHDKLRLVFGKISADLAEISFDFVRLGRNGDHRPILVKLSSAAIARSVLKAKQKLSNVDQLRRVFIGPDLTAAEAKESARLRKALKDARGDPRNLGKAVSLDKGKLVVNGIVVDSRAPVPFLA